MRTMHHALTPQDMWNAIHNRRAFAELPPEEFSQMMSLMHIEHIPNGTLLLKQHGNDPNLYVIRRGKAAARVAVQGGVDPIQDFFRPGDVINEVSFLTGKINDMTVEAADDLEVWVIPGNDFRALRADVPSIEENLVYPEAARDYITTTREFDDQRPGERILWRSRKHWWVFFSGATPSWLTLLALIATHAFGIREPLFGVFLWSTIGFPIWTIALVLAVLWIVWSWIDWRNDYYLVTDQRVVHRERVLLLYDQQDECPIAKVQNVNVRRSSWVNSVFDVGDVAVETQGTRANVEFMWVGKPDAAQKAIMQHVTQARVVNHAAEKAKIRASIRSEMRIGGEHKPKTDMNYKPRSEAERVASLPWPKKIAAYAKTLRYTVIPPMRQQDGSDVIYHKHWLGLVSSTAMPFVALLVFGTLVVTMPFINVGIAVLMFRTLLVIPLILLGLALLGWLIWQYEDWRNDIYVLKPDMLVDTDRTPFGFGGTSQKTATMANVQNVTYITRGVLDSVFNIGDVSIKTGGQDGELVFERVWNPRRVQRDIVDRLEVFQTRRREAESEARRREMAEWIGIYDELARMHERKKLG